MKALWISEGGKVGIKTLSLADLMDGDVLIKVSHSSLNYKDALAVTGRAKVVRRFPMIPGIDLAGIVVESSNSLFQTNDRVLLTGYGIGELHFGGYADYAKVRGDWLLHIPDEFSFEQAMAVGTAGLTAMVAVMALEERGRIKDKGDVVVTGANGGVGSLAIMILSKLGYKVTASTRRWQYRSRLLELGAQHIIKSDELATGPVQPLAHERWHGAIDCVGSTTLANILSIMRYGGAVATCGLVQGMELSVTVAPFILRSVALLGIDSVQLPMKERVRAWKRLAGTLDKIMLDRISTKIALDDVVGCATRVLSGQVLGRVIIALG